MAPYKLSLIRSSLLLMFMQAEVFSLQAFADQVLLDAPNANYSYYGMYAPSPSTAASFTLTASYNVSTITVALRTSAQTSYTNFDFSLQNALSGSVTTYAHETLTAAVGGTSTRVLNVNKTLPAGTYYLVSGVPGYFGASVTPNDVSGWMMSTGRYSNAAGNVTDGVWFSSGSTWRLTSGVNNGVSYYAPAFTVNGSPVTGQGTWRMVPVSSAPPPRGLHAMVFDEAHNELVLFGGIAGESIYLGDTWTWNGSSWQQRSTPVAPARRAGHAMAYDAAHGQVVLFGGANLDSGILYNDTWIWNGSQWTQKSVSSSPPGRTWNAMAYDSARQQIVLFGGFDGYYSGYNDTWVWDGSNWTRKTPANAPVGRAGHAMAFDSVRSKVVLFGGSANYQNFDDTWTWDGVNWTQQSVVSHPSERFWSTMAFDAVHGETILFGGGDDTYEFNDTWAWDGIHWTRKLPSVSPSARVGATMAYDVVGKTPLLFGGGSDISGAFSSELWIWGGGSVSSPSISGISPTSGLLGTSIPNFQVNGSNFTSTSTISFSGSGINVTSYNSRTANQILANIYIAANAMSGLRDVAISNPDGQTAMLAGAFTVRVPPSATISTVAGNGTNGFDGDGGPAVTAQLNFPFGIAVDTAGTLFIADLFNHRVRKVTSDGVIKTVAGNGSQGYSGDGGPAAQAQLNRPSGVAVDAAGNIYIADAGNNRIRKVTPNGGISTVAGTGPQGFSGDGGPAISARLLDPWGVSVDGAGNLFIADTGNARIRRVAPNGTISTFAGGATSGLGDGGQAISAQLAMPTGVAVDALGNLFIADRNNNRVRKVTPDGVIRTVAGNGIQGFSGDGGAAVSAQLNYPHGIAVDAAGNLFIADYNNCRIRKVTPGGIIGSIAGTGAGSFSGDGGPATSALLNWPEAVAVDAAGDVYIADTLNQRIRKIAGWPKDMHVIYSQALVPSNPGEYSNLPTPGHQQIADDFHLIAGATLTGLTWQGRYDINGLSPSSVSFVIRVFADSAGLPAVGPLFSANVTVTPAVLSNAYTMPPQFGGNSINWLEYSASLPNWTLGPGTYWLSILENDSGTPPLGSSQWLWADSENGTVAQNPSVASRAGDGDAWTLVGPIEADHAFLLQGLLKPSMVLSSGGAALRSTAGTRESTAAGYATATINSGAAPYATAVFSYRQNGVTVTEAGVPASPPTTLARIFIDYRTNVNAVPGRSDSGTIDVNTGIAVVNGSSSTAHITYTLRSMTGDPITTGHGVLAGGQKFACFIDNLRENAAPDFSLPSSFRTAIQFGSLEIASDQPVSVLALRGTTNQRSEFLMTTTPVADLAQAPSYDPKYFPQLADGGGYTTSLLLLNTSTQSERGTLQILDGNGAPVIVNQVGGTVGSSFAYSIPAGGAFRFQTDGFSSNIKTGWVKLTPDVYNRTPIGSGVFSYNPSDTLISESGIPAAAATTHARVYVDLSGGHNTGLAIANVSNTSSSIVVNAFQKDGVTAVGDSKQRDPLPANGYTAAFADGFVTGLPEEFTGVLDISSTRPFAALTLRSLDNERGDFLMTTFPVADANQTAPSPVVFPHIADGGGYVTQFIMISSGQPASTILNYYEENGVPTDFGN
jgi:hypothetical protein